MINVNSIAIAESKNNHKLRGTSGERGAHQIMPDGVLADWNANHNQQQQYIADDLEDTAISGKIANWWLNDWCPNHYFKAYSIADSDLNRIIAWNRGISIMHKWYQEGENFGRLPLATINLIKRYQEAEEKNERS